MSAVTGPISYHGPVPEPQRGGADNYLNHERGLLSWLLTLDHKRIALLYMAGILTAFFIGGVFAIMIRTLLWSPRGTAASNDLYNHVFSLHGAVMVFMFIIPVIPAIFGNFVLPMQLGEIGRASCRERV